MDCCSFELLDAGFAVLAVALVDVVVAGFVFESDAVCGLILLAAAVGFVVLVFEGVVDTVVVFVAGFGVALA